MKVKFIKRHPSGLKEGVEKELAYSHASRLIEQGFVEIVEASKEEQAAEKKKEAAKKARAEAVAAEIRAQAQHDKEEKEKAEKIAKMKLSEAQTKEKEAQIAAGQAAENKRLAAEAAEKIKD